MLWCCSSTSASTAQVQQQHQPPLPQTAMGWRRLLLALKQQSQVQMTAWCLQRLLVRVQGLSLVLKRAQYPTQSQLLLGMLLLPQQ
jgi:hypothetical protein